MKKLFGNRASRDDKALLINKTVQVGQHQVRVDALLGSGGYADIYRVTDISSGQKYALKHLRLNGDQEIIKEVQHEAKTQAKLRGHPNILRLYAVAFAGPKGGETDGFFLLDFCPGTLLDLLARHNFSLEERTVIHIFNCVCQAIAHMHRQKPPLAHRDLKAENVLMLPDGTWILCDYGSATSRAQVYDTPEAMAAEEEVIRKHTTPAYRPPEMWDLYQRHLIDIKVDIWALGVLLFVLCYGRLPFTGDSKLQVINAKYEMPQTRAPQLRALIRQLLTVDPAQRPNISEVLEQLDQAATAITGRGITMKATPGAAAAKAPAATTQQSQQQQQPAPVPQQQQLHETVKQFIQQQQQQQQPPPQPAQQSSAASSGSFWGTASAAAGAGSGDSGTAASGVPQEQQQQQQSSTPQDWARFSSGGGVQGPMTAATAPVPPSAAASVRAHALQSPMDSPLATSADAGNSGSSSSSPHKADGLVTTRSNGPAAGQHSGSTASGSRLQQQQGPDFAKLADITARAATAAAAANRGQPDTASQQQQYSDPSNTTAAATASSSQPAVKTDPPLVLERQSRPYSSGGSISSTSNSAAAAAAVTSTSLPGGAVSHFHHHSSSSGPASNNSSAGSAPHTPTAAARGGQAAAGDSRFKQQQQDFLAAGNVANKAAVIAANHQQQQQQQQGVGHTSIPHQVVSNNLRPPTVAATTAMQAVGPTGSMTAVGGDTAAAAVSDLRTSVFSEVDLLKAQIRSLTDDHQAFLFRIKQLEDYTQKQAEVMITMQQHIQALQLLVQQQQQQLGSQQVTHGAGGGSAAAQQQQNSVPPQQQQRGSDALSGWLRRPGPGSAGVDTSGSSSPHQQQQQHQGVTSNASAGSFWSTQNAVL